MNTFGGKIRERTISAYEIVEQAMSPNFSHTSRCRKKSDRSSGGRKSSMASSIDSFISGARTSLSDFLSDFAETSEDTATDIMRKIHSGSNNREERRRRMRKRYRDLYSNTNNCAFESLETKTLPNDKINRPCFQRNVDSVFSKGLSYGSDGDKVQRWVASSRQLSHAMTPEETRIANLKIKSLKSNSDSMRRKLMPPAIDEAEIRKSDSQLFQTLYREDLAPTFTFYQTKDQDVSLSTLGSFDGTSPKLLSMDSKLNETLAAKQEGHSIKDEFEHVKIPYLTPRLSSEGSSEKLEIQMRQQMTRSKAFSGDTEEAANATRIVGTIYIAIKFIDLSNLLKLTIESINIIYKEPCFATDTPIFVKVYMTLTNKVEKMSSKIVKFKNLTFFNQDMFLKIKDAESAKRPLLRLAVYRRKSLFARQRHKPIGETSFYVNKEEIGDKLELSQLLITSI